MKMCALVVLYFPARFLQRRIDVFAGFGRHAQASSKTWILGGEAYVVSLRNASFLSGGLV